MSSNVDDRLNWLAMQYVLGELSDADRDQFEARLADDLTACEAVVEASRTRLVLHAALASSVVANAARGEQLCDASLILRPVRSSAPVTIRRSRQAIAAGVAAVACLFLVMVFGWRDAADSFRSRVAFHSDRTAMELVSRWRTESKYAEVETDDGDDELHESVTEVAVPGWLLAGVSLEKHGSIDDQPEDVQEN